MRKLVMAALAAALLLPAIAVPIVEASHPNPCNSGTEAYYQKYAAKYWPGAPYLYYDGSHGETHIRDLEPCEYSLLEGGWTSVWPANLDNGTLGGGGLVQLGYLECTPTITCNNARGNGVLGRGFVYTPFDRAANGFKAGYFEKATWAGSPEVGDLYEFKIRSARVNDNYYWDYCIQNKTDGEAEMCKRVAATWHLGGRSWHLFETNNSNSRMGADYGDPATEIYQMAYRTTNGTWFDYDQNTCDTGVPANSAYRCVDGGTYDIRAYTFH